MFISAAIEQLPDNPSIFVLTDNRGNFVGAGSQDVLQELLGKMKRCSPFQSSDAHSADACPDQQVFLTTA